MSKQSSQLTDDVLKSGVLTIYKKVGETPLQCLDRLRIEHPEYEGATLSYLGRLDPLAEGILLVAVGEENKNRHSYLQLDKEYEVEILLGVETDTHDILGLVKTKDEQFTLPDEDEIQKVIQEFVGKTEVPYPVFSSKPHKGKSLFEWGKEGLPDDEILPTTHLDIQDIKYIDTKQITSQDIEVEIYKRIDLVTGDFRQEQIKEAWKTYFEHAKVLSYTIITISVTCKSGTYMRTLAQEIGKKLKTGALAFSIKRTRLGGYNSETLS